MRWARRGWSRLIGALGGRRRERELAEELESHIQMQTEDNMRLGMSPPEARRAAIVKLGGVEMTKELVREQRGLPRLESLVRDVRYAARGIRRAPGFAVAVILTLALGVGANTAIFTVVHAVLLKPLPYADPERIHSVEVVIPERSSQFESIPVLVQAYLRWREADTVFESMSVLRPWECNLTGDGEPERLGGARVSANFFSVLGVPVAHGREFSSEEEQPGKEKVVVISDLLWRRRYGGDPSMIGRHIQINGEEHLVVGIASPSLLVPTGTQLHPLLPFAPGVDLWKPIAPSERELRNESWDHGLLVRLRPGADPERGRQQLQGMLNAMTFPKSRRQAELIPRLVPIREVYAGRVRLRLLLVQAAAGLLLLAACTNIASLFMARVASRSADFAVRVALGAGRGRITCQTLSESILLAVLGGLLGGLLARYGARYLATRGPIDVQMMADPRLNPAVLGFALAASFATGIACGLYPSWKAFRKDAAEDLKEGAKGALSNRASGRFRQILVGTEMAVATVLLVSAGLLVHSFVNVMDADRGYQVEHVLAADLSLFGERYDPGESRIEFYRQLGRNVRALPAVLAAGTISDLPAVAGSSGASRTIFLANDSDFKSMFLSRPVALIRSVTRGYFAASGTLLRAGRVFADREEVPVAIISETLAKGLWPGDSPAAVIGRGVRQGNVTGPLIQIAGVVEDVRPGAVDQEAQPLIYRPHGQWASGPMTLVVKTAGNPADLAGPVRAVIRSMDSNLPVPAMRTMREIISESVSQRRFQTLLTALFAAVALLLGAVGIYGVVSYSVACRTREVGLRIALGALRNDVVGWIISRGMKPVVIGLAVGLGGSLLIARALRGLLFEIAPTDPVSLGSVALILLVTSALACYFPARRAARLDPVIALRHE